MFDQLRTNLILLVLNIIALANFSYTPHNQSLVIFVLFLIIPLPYQIKNKVKIVTVLSLIAVFLTNPMACEVFCLLALGLAVNTAYQLDLTEGPSFINAALGLSQILSYWSKQYLQKDSINRDITLLIFTLPNLFLSCRCQLIKSKKLFLINPYLDGNWLYSVGFVLGIFTTSLISIPKHYKFLAISIILLIQSSVLQIQALVGLLNFLRGILVYTEHTHQSQKYFLIGFLLVKVFFKQYLYYFMFIGYLIISVILYKQYTQKKQSRKAKKDEAVGTQQSLEYQAQLSNMIEMKIR